MRTTTTSVIARKTPLILLSALLLLCHQLGEAAVSVVVGATIERAVNHGTPTQLGLWLAILAATFIGLSLSYRFGSRAAARTAADIEHELRLPIIAAALEPGRPHPQESAAATTVSIATSDARRVAGAVRTTISVVVAALTIVTTALVLAHSSALLAALVLVSALLVLVALAVAGRPLQKRSEAEQQQSAATAALATEYARGIRVLAGLGAGTAASARYRAQSRLSLRHTVRAATFDGGLNGFTSLIVGLYLAGVGLETGRRALAGQLSLAEMISVLGLAQFVLGPMQTLGLFGAALARGQASATRIAGAAAAGTLHDSKSGPLPAEHPESAGRHGLGSAIFADTRDALVARTGRITGVAATDAQTADALVRSLSDRTGRRTSSHQDAGTAPAGGDSRTAARTLVLPHNTALFGRTLDEALRTRGSDPGRTGDAVDAAALRDVVSRSPAGLGQRLTDGALSLSGGERQRLALARALATDAPTLVLHEPTTAVDSATEALIAAGIRRIRAGRTTVLVTTSPQLLAACDDVILIDDGAVDRAGTHDELIASSSAYRQAVLR